MAPSTDNEDADIAVQTPFFSNQTTSTNDPHARALKRMTCVSPKGRDTRTRMTYSRDVCASPEGARLCPASARTDGGSGGEHVGNDDAGSDGTDDPDDAGGVDDVGDAGGADDPDDVADPDDVDVADDMDVADDGENHGGTEEDRSTRARRESMTVYPLRDRRYLVDTAGGTYVVALDVGTCSCPDHEIRGSRCKHLRRVAMAVTEGTLPSPDERVGVCAVCGVETFVPLASAGPHLCARHDFTRGDAALDRETGKLLVITGVTDLRADEYRTDEGRPAAEYPTNVEYGTHEPVVEAVYAESLTPTHGIDDARRYGFPASRLVPAETASQTGLHDHET